MIVNCGVQMVGERLKESNILHPECFCITSSLLLRVKCRVVPSTEQKSRVPRGRHTNAVMFNSALIGSVCRYEVHECVWCCCQGEVEQIAMMKPKGQTEHDEGMLEYLEDIIGSCRLKEPIHVLCRRVELLNEQRGEKVR